MGLNLLLLIHAALYYGIGTTSRRGFWEFVLMMDCAVDQPSFMLGLLSSKRSIHLEVKSAVNSPLHPREVIKQFASKDIHPIQIPRDRKQTPTAPVNEGEKQSLRALVGLYSMQL